MYDVMIVGAGVVGTSIARELSRYSMKIGVLEKEEDVAMGTTKANSAIVHSGYDAPPDTLKGRLNAKGNAMFDKLSEELDFPFKRNGSLVLCFNAKDLSKLELLKKQGEINGVPDIKIISGDEVRKMEPNVSEEVVAALYLPTGGIVCPYEMTVALAENAYTNGVEFYFNRKVEAVKPIEGGYKVETSDGDFESRIVINAAGVYADDLNNMVSDDKLAILPRKGEYCLFDKAVGNTIATTLFQLPSELGKGVLVTPTVDGNLLIGPNAADLLDKDNNDTTKDGMEEILLTARKSIQNIPMHALITSFSGLRARLESEDFIIEEASDAKNFINVAGIQSPGLSSAPAIAELVRNIVVEAIKPELNIEFNPIRKGIPKFREMNNAQRSSYIKQNPAYGRVLCRCETVTEAEIIEAIRRPLGAKSLDGVKRRTRAGMGRCQSGFCSTRILEILARELGISKEQVTKAGGDSYLLV